MLEEDSSSIFWIRLCIHIFFFFYLPHLFITVEERPCEWNSFQAEASAVFWLKHMTFC